MEMFGLEILIGLQVLPAALDVVAALGAQAASFVAAAAAFLDSSDGDMAGAFAVLLLSGPAFYTITYLRYRNSDKRHIHEAETPIEMSGLRQYDNFVQHLTRQRSATIDGANDSAVRGSLLGDQGVGDALGNAMSSVLGVSEIAESFRNGFSPEITITKTSSNSFTGKKTKTVKKYKIGDKK